MSRDQYVAQALTTLGETRLLAFVRAVRQEIFAAKMCNEELDRGLTLPEILLTGHRYGYSLHVTPTARPQEFEIEFGYVAGPTAGDGGAWHVVFDEAGNVVQAERSVYWIA